MKIKNFGSRTPVESIDRMAWGYIEFEGPLTEREAMGYDLAEERIGNE